jgi:hypothetical protein
MRQWIRSHLTFANVVSLAALFVALGGTATAVTYVVSSNSQIGPGTISGHKPPTGKHANIIGGSVNGKDVADNSLGGAKINDSTLTNAQVRDFALSTGTNGGDTLKSLGGLTLTWSALGSSGTPPIYCYLRASTSAQGEFNAFKAWSAAGGSSADTFGYGTATPATDWVIAQAVSDVNRQRADGEFIFHNVSSGRVLSVAYHVFAYPQNTGCQFQGTITATQ